MNKFCKDCKWFKKGWLEAVHLAKCVHPTLAPLSPNMVTGRVDQRVTYCSTQRSEYGKCKPIGDYWEAQ